VSDNLQQTKFQGQQLSAVVIWYRLYLFFRSSVSVSSAFFLFSYMWIWW